MKLIAIATNKAPISASAEWVKLSSYGVFAHPLGRQKLDKAAAAEVVMALNSERSKAGEAWRGVPAFIGHPPGRGGDKADKRSFPRIGAIHECEARADGLWGKVAWNNLGEENAREGHFVYPSPAWFFHNDGNGQIRPCKLDHVGMTNSPNIPDVPPWTNEATEPDNTTMKKQICAALGLAEDAPDEDVITAVQSLTQAKTEATEGQKTESKEKEDALALANNEKAARETVETQLTTEKTAREAAVNELASAKAAHAKTLIDLAVNSGCITMSERGTHEAAFAADFTVAANELGKLKPKVNTKPIVLEMNGARRSIAAANERADIISTAVNERMAKNGGDYAAAYLGVKNDPQFAPVFAAMEQPTADK